MRPHQLRWLLDGLDPVSIPSLNLTPYVGIRVNSLTVDKYNTKLHGATASTSEDMDSTTVQFPVGLTLSKDIATEGGWKLNPNFDLGALFTVGDTDVDQRTRLTGAIGSATMNNEIVDKVTFQGGLGFGAEKDGLNLSLDYSLNASKNVTSHGISAMTRYEFR